MNKNITWKLVVIVGILLIFMFGIFGNPMGWSGKGLVASMRDQIHLGLDLRGGTHLILQVQVNDAVNVDSDNAIARLKEDMRSRKISHMAISRAALSAVNACTAAPALRPPHPIMPTLSASPPAAQALRLTSSAPTAAIEAAAAEVLRKFLRVIGSDPG